MSNYEGYGGYFCVGTKYGVQLACGVGCCGGKPSSKNESNLDCCPALNLLMWLKDLTKYDAAIMLYNEVGSSKSLKY